MSLKFVLNNNNNVVFRKSYQSYVPVHSLSKQNYCYNDHFYFVYISFVYIFYVTYTHSNNFLIDEKYAYVDRNLKMSKS